MSIREPFFLFHSGEYKSFVRPFGDFLKQHIIINYKLGIMFRAQKFFHLGIEHWQFGLTFYRVGENKYFFQKDYFIKGGLGKIEEYIKEYFEPFSARSLQEQSLVDGTERFFKNI